MTSIRLRPSSSWPSGLLCAAALALAGCDGEGSDGHDHHHGHAPDPDTYLDSGITKASDDDAFMVTLVSDPAPRKGMHTWELAVMQHDDAGGDAAMVEGATITVEPWMPEHGHGSDSEAVVEDVGQGRYVADPVELQMRGTWDTTITIVQGDVTDTVHFVFAVE